MCPFSRGKNCSKSEMPCFIAHDDNKVSECFIYKDNNGNVFNTDFNPLAALFNSLPKRKQNESGN